LWPTKTCVIRHCEIFPDETNNGDEDANTDDAKDDGMKNNDDDNNFGNTPEEAALECLCNADLLQRAFTISGPPHIVGSRDWRLHADGSARHRFVMLQPTFSQFIRAQKKQ
jgi:hypothetical protein